MQTKKQVMEMAARGEGCLGKAADDEPVFVLRGQDITMPRVVAFWSMLAKTECGASGGNSKTAEADNFVRELVDWQAVHKVKAPD